jgi:hypothetical protein
MSGMKLITDFGGDLIEAAHIIRLVFQKMIKSRMD